MKTWTNKGYCSWPISCPWRICIYRDTWWRHQMETFSTLLAICVGNSPVTGEFPAQRPVTRSFDVFFDLRLNKRLSKQAWGRWFEMPSRPLWRHCDVYTRQLDPHRGCRCPSNEVWQVIRGPWWHHQMETFSFTGHLWGESTSHWWIPLTKSSDRKPWYFFDLCLNKRLSKQSRHQWFETPLCLLWCHCNGTALTTKG